MTGPPKDGLGCGTPTAVGRTARFRRSKNRDDGGSFPAAVLTLFLAIEVQQSGRAVGPGRRYFGPARGYAALNGNFTVVFEPFGACAITWSTYASPELRRWAGIAIWNGTVPGTSSV
jgi:hypothetical protein